MSKNTLSKNTLPKNTVALNLNPNIPDPDGFYQELIDSQRDMDEAQAAMMNCKLVLILANHIGDREVIRQALKVAGGKAG